MGVIVGAAVGALVAPYVPFDDIKKRCLLGSLPNPSVEVGDEGSASFVVNQFRAQLFVHIQL